MTDETYVYRKVMGKGYHRAGDFAVDLALADLERQIALIPYVVEVSGIAVTVLTDEFLVTASAIVKVASGLPLATVLVAPETLGMKVTPPERIGVEPPSASTDDGQLPMF